MVMLQTPPKLVYDEANELVEVVLSADDFRAYLRAVANDSDWDALPTFLQDAVDLLLIDDVRGERDDAIDFNEVLASDVA